MVIRNKSSYKAKSPFLFTARNVKDQSWRMSDSRIGGQRKIVFKGVSRAHLSDLSLVEGAELQVE